jgi:hypothetical protein
LQAVAGGERKVGGSAEQAAFVRRERAPVLRRVDELVTLFGWQVAHPADRPADSLAAVRRQLPELLKYLSRPLLLILRQVLPGFHAVEHPLLLLRWQIGKMLQPVLQSHLLLRRKPSELRIVFERAALLRGRQILIAAKPVSGVPGLVLRRMRFIGAAGVRAAFFLKPVPLPIRTLGLLMRLLRRLRRPRLMPSLGERQRQQQKHRQTARNLRPAQHALVPSSVSANLQLASHKRNFLTCRDGACPVSAARDSGSRIRGYVVLHLQFVDHIEIGIQLAVPLQRLQIADGASRLHRQTEGRRLGRDSFGLRNIRLVAD